MKNKCLVIINKLGHYDCGFLNEMTSYLDNFKNEYKLENLQYICERDNTFLFKVLGKDTKLIKSTYSNINSFEDSTFYLNNKTLNYKDLFKTFKHIIFLGFNSTSQITFNICSFFENKTTTHFLNKENIFGNYTFI